MMNLEELLEILKEMYEKHGNVSVRIGSNLNYLASVNFDDISCEVRIHGQQ